MSVTQKENVIDGIKEEEEKLAQSFYPSFEKKSVYEQFKQNNHDNEEHVALLIPFFDRLNIDASDYFTQCKDLDALCTTFLNFAICQNSTAKFSLSIAVFFGQLRESCALLITRLYFQHYKTLFSQLGFFIAQKILQLFLLPFSNSNFTSLKELKNVISIDDEKLLYFLLHVSAPTVAHIPLFQEIFQEKFFPVCSVETAVNLKNSLFLHIVDIQGSEAVYSSLVSSLLFECLNFIKKEPNSSLVFEFITNLPSSISKFLSSNKSGELEQYVLCLFASKFKIAFFFIVHIWSSSSCVLV